jgi:hypothetical protein
MRNVSTVENEYKLSNVKLPLDVRHIYLLILRETNFVTINNIISSICYHIMSPCIGQKSRFCVIACQWKLATLETSIKLSCDPEVILIYTSAFNSHPPSLKYRPNVGIWGPATYQPDHRYRLRLIVEDRQAEFNN